MSALLALGLTSFAGGQTINTIAGTGAKGFTGDGAAATSATLNKPHGIAVDDDGNVYIADKDNKVVRKVDAVTGIITTFAGGGSALIGDGLAATAAKLSKPVASYIDSSGNIYIADTDNHRIRKVDGATSIINTIGGTGTKEYLGDGGAATSADLNKPRGVVLDSSGNIFFSDSDNHVIRKITSGGVISTIAGTGSKGYSGDGAAATAAKINKPYAIAIDADDNLYFAEKDSHVIRKIDAATGIISTVAGTGSEGSSGDGGAATSAKFNKPRGVWVVQNPATEGNATILSSDQGSVDSRQIATQVTVSAAGTLKSITAYIDGMTSKNVRYAIYSDSGGEPDALLAETAAVAGANGFQWYTISTPNTSLAAGTYWLAMSFGHGNYEYKYDVAGAATRHNGNDAVGGSFTATWGAPTASNSRKISIYATLLPTPTVYVADTDNHRIRKFTVGGAIATVAGNGSKGSSGDGGSATSAKLNKPEGIVVDASGNFFIADKDNNRVRKVTAGGTISTYAGNGSKGYSGDGGAATTAKVNKPTGVFLDGSGNLYVADKDNSAIRKVDASTGSITTVAGTGDPDGNGFAATSAPLGKIEDVAIGPDGYLYIADTEKDKIRKVNLSTGIIYGVMGYGDEESPADPTEDLLMDQPAAVAIDSSGNVYTVEKSKNSARLLKYTAATGQYSTLAGSSTLGFSGDGGAATAAQLKKPHGVAVDKDGNVYIADKDNHRVRKIDAATGIITTIAGTGADGYDGDGGLATSAKVGKPARVAVDCFAQYLFIVQKDNHVIRRVTLADGTITTIAGTGGAGFSGDGSDAILANLNKPIGIGFMRKKVSNIYIGDSDNHRVRSVDLTVGGCAVTIIKWQEVKNTP